LSLFDSGVLLEIDEKRIMKIQIYYPYANSHEEIEKEKRITEHKHGLNADRLEEQAPFTLDLIYHRRKPRAAALISLLVPGFGGLGQLLLGQETKAGILLIMEWFILMPIGIAIKSLPYLLLSFHLLLALDAWILAGRLLKGETLEKWEWFWERQSER
jgi:hypothetical protein